eukprot:jgi/Mesvir1/18066/Mv09376-RA.3
MESVCSLATQACKQLLVSGVSVSLHHARAQAATLCRRSLGFPRAISSVPHSRRSLGSLSHLPVLKRKFTSQRRVPFAPGASMAATATEITGPAWNLVTEYPSLTSPELKADQDEAAALVEAIKDACKSLNVEDNNPDVDHLEKIARKIQRATMLLENLGAYANCFKSVNGKDEAARALMSTVLQMASLLSQASEPLTLLLKLCPDSVVEAYLARVPEERYPVLHARERRALALPLAEERLVSALSVDGFTSWGTLYEALASSLQCDVAGVGSMGVARALSLLSNPDRAVRRAAFEAVQAAWKTAEEPASATLNSIAGWRLEMNRQRGARAGREVHYLEDALHNYCMSKATLDAMMKAVTEDGMAVAHRAMRLQARLHGVAKLHPADLMAPTPQLNIEGAGSEPPPVPFDEAIELIANAVGEVAPDMGQFVRMMAANQWIEATTGDAKAPGFYCTGFKKSRQPRVYMSAYSGSPYIISTLAHELGHAYHDWVMRDMPLAETNYPMNLAETASIFFETVVADAFMRRSTSVADQIRQGWSEMEGLVAYLLNIPARFDFECALYEARKSGQVSNPAKLREMMTSAWAKHYGDTLESYDEMFWASKMHFHLTSISFYVSVAVVVSEIGVVCAHPLPPNLHRLLCEYCAIDFGLRYAVTISSG